MDYEVVVGLEVHIRLKTKSKIFCADQNKYGDHPNHHVSAISLAHPGTLPRLNKTAINAGIKFTYAVEGKVGINCAFDRKHYFYPDSPNGYQITQDQLPICIGGHLDIEVKDKIKRIRLHHAHLEADAGKLIHEEQGNHSAVDLNRAGVPLLEIVTEPDFRSGEEVAEFLKNLQQLVRYVEVSDANMEEGSMRCDCNISVMPQGSTQLGTRCEVKNINSRKFAQQAIAFEAKRQIQLIESGQSISQQTRHFDATNGTTFTSREKEDAHDYRYFPDPDIPPIKISNAKLLELKESMPILPKQALCQLVKDYKLSDYQAQQISNEKSHYLAFTQYAKDTSAHKALANILINKVIPYCSENSISMDQFPIKSEKIGNFIELIESNQVSSSLAMQQLFPKMLDHQGTAVIDLAKELNILIDKTESTDYAVSLVAQVIESAPDEVQKYKSGKKALIGFFIGQAMKMKNQGVDPKRLKEEFLKQLS